MRIISGGASDPLSDAVRLRLHTSKSKPGIRQVKVTREDGTVVFAALRDGKVNETIITSAVDRRLYVSNGMRQPLATGFIVDRRG